MSGEETDCEVAIVGCGPVGAIAANLFGHAGLRTVVIEREREPYPLPRAVHIDHEMMRIFQSVGLADAVLPLMREAQGHIHIGADGGVIRYLGSAGLPKRFGWANDYFFFQPELEQAMQTGMSRFPHVALQRGVAVTALEQAPDGVRLTTEGATGEQRVTARYVVACDGANSFVRKSLGIQLDDMQFHEPWLVVDAEVEGPISFPEFAGVPPGADLQHLSVMLCDPTRPATLVPGTWQSSPVGVHAVAGRARRGNDGAGSREGARRALCTRNVAPDHACGDVSLSWSGRRAMAARPRFSCGRCRAPDAAVLRARDVPRHARCREPRLEICRGASAQGGSRAARHIPGRTRAACARRDRRRRSRRVDISASAIPPLRASATKPCAPRWASPRLRVRATSSRRSVPASSTGTDKAAPGHRRALHSAVRGGRRSAHAAGRCDSEGAFCPASVVSKFDYRLTPNAHRGSVSAPNRS